MHLTDRSIPSCLSNLSNLHLIWCRFSRIHKVGYSELINFKLFGFISLCVDVTGNELLKVEFVNLCSDRWPWTLLNHPFFCPNRWETDRVKITAFYSHHFSICRLSQTQASSINGTHRINLPSSHPPVALIFPFTHSFFATGSAVTADLFYGYCL